MKNPRSKDAVRALGGERLLQPVAAGQEQLPGELGEAAAPEPAQGFRAEGEAGRRPELGPEHSEREIRVREEPLEDAGPLWAELLRIALGRAQQERGGSVGKRGRGRQLGVQVL